MQCLLWLWFGGGQYDIEADAFVDDNINHYHSDDVYYLSIGYNMHPFVVILSLSAVNGVVFSHYYDDDKIAKIYWLNSCFWYEKILSIFISYWLSRIILSLSSWRGLLQEEEAIKAVAAGLTTKTTARALFCSWVVVDRHVSTGRWPTTDCIVVLAAILELRLVYRIMLLTFCLRHTIRNRNPRYCLLR